jgi:N-acetylglucosamine malate deacetylase 1
MINFDLTNKRILSFSAHPDDEAAVGGFLAAAKAAGAAIEFALVLDPAEPRFDVTAEEDRTRRLAEFNNAADLLGATTSYLDLPLYPTLDRKNTLALVKTIRIFKPDIIITLSDEERHTDHRLVNSLVKHAIWHAGRAAFPDLGEPHKTNTLLAYEADNPIREPTFLFDITNFVENKKAHIGCYGSQTTQKDLCEASLGLNRFRGTMYKAGMYAEAFKVIQLFYG